VLPPVPGVWIGPVPSWGPIFFPFCVPACCRVAVALPLNGKSRAGSALADAIKSVANAKNGLVIEVSFRLRWNKMQLRRHLNRLVKSTA
jgi:hypothetical protein